jgi:hypothetical protein
MSPPEKNGFLLPAPAHRIDVVKVILLRHSALLTGRRMKLKFMYSLVLAAGESR